MTNWQQIETAPKNGTRVLVVARAYGVTYYGYCHFESFADGSSGWIGGSFATIPPGSFSAFLAPTHWMPLPDPPVVGHVHSRNSAKLELDR